MTIGKIAEAKHCLARFARTADEQMGALQDESNDGRSQAQSEMRDLAGEICH